MPNIPVYEGLLFSTFQQLRQSTPQGLAIAFTSATSGEGVTHTIASLLNGLSREPSTRTLALDSRLLPRLDCPPAETVALCRSFNPGLFELIPPSPTPQGLWEGSWEYRRDTLLALRQAFDYILIDTPSLREANDLLALAPFVEGVILVVEAGRTRRDQILQAEKTIDFARGKLLGHILNKRRYVIPAWLYSRL